MRLQNIEWPLLPNSFLTLKGISAGFSIDNFHDSRKRSIDASLTGTLAVGSGANQFGLAASVRIPSLDLAADLLDDTPIKVNALLGHLGLPEADSALEISQLSLDANPRYKTFAISATIDNVWKIQLGFLDLEVQSLELSVDHSPNATGVEIAGQLELQSPFKLPFRIAARRPAGEHWLFSGEIPNPCRWPPSQPPSSRKLPALRSISPSAASTTRSPDWTCRTWRSRWKRAPAASTPSMQALIGF